MLDAFFAVERDCFLSRGGALVGFHLSHRTTTDLDLFTSSAEAFERARVVLPNVVDRIGGSVVVRQDAPGFRRVVVSRAGEELVVDLVRDIGPWMHPKGAVGPIVLDPIEEVFSNKLTTLVSRQEVRDLVDVMELERRGLRAEDFLAEAAAKDGGCTPATLAFLLHGWTIPNEARVPDGYTADELRAFKASLAERMVVAARPR